MHTARTPGRRDGPMMSRTLSRTRSLMLGAVLLSLAAPPPQSAAAAAQARVSAARLEATPRSAPGADVNAITTPVVEFYNPALDHYFITSDTREIADLDTAVHPGWRRTGLAFDAYPAAGAGSSPVCR